MTRPTKVTPRQLDVLHRLADGPPLTKDDAALATSIYALRRRHLVTTPTQHGWLRASVTVAGHAYLAGDGAPAPSARRTRTVREADTRPLRITADELADRVLAAGGRLTIDDPSDEVRAAWRRAIHAATEAGLPSGYRVRHQGRNRGDLTITLVADRDVQPIQQPPRLVVPDEVRDPVLRATKRAAGRRRTGWIDTTATRGVLHFLVTPAQLHRVLFCAQALIDEALRRGHQVATDTGGCGGLAIGVSNQYVEVTFAEERHRVEVPGRSGSGGWRPAEYRYESTGRLEIHRSHPGYRTRLAADRTRWTLEDRLGHVLEAVEIYAAERAAQQLAEEHRRAQRREAWESAIEQAKARLVESARLAVLDEQLRARRLAGDIRAFVADAAACPDPVSATHRDRWLSWLTTYADGIDPRLHPLDVPDAPEPTPQALLPFLDGWSPYGPERWSGRR
jgi:hypothetical protein